MAVTYATRGDFAESLYELIGFESPTSTEKFSDAGGAASTLFDLGITNGIGDGKYGSDQGITRGEAFLMIARALGMADKTTDMAYAANLLVEAGIIQGMGGDPTQLGLDQPIQTDHLALLLDPKSGRIAPLMEDTDDRTTGATLRDTLMSNADDARTTNIAENDPAFATFLAEIGVQKDERQAAIDFAMGQHELNLSMMRDQYEDSLDDALLQNRMGWENRGLSRSGMVGRDATEAITDNTRAREAAIFAAEDAHQAYITEQKNIMASYDRDLLAQASQAETNLTQKQIEEAYDYTFGTGY